MSTASSSVSGSPTSHGLFDSHGRLIPTAGDVVYSQVDRRYFQLVQPKLDFAQIHARVAKHLGVPNLDAILSRADFEARCDAQKKKLLAKPETAGLFSGVHVPFLLVPQTAQADVGEEVESKLLGPVGASFTEALPKYTFKNYAAGQLAGQLAIVPNVRYERLIAAHKERAIAGWYFPTVTTGYAVPDQRKAMARVPDDLCLSGPLEAAMALLGTPDTLVTTERYPNLLGLTAVQPKDPKMFHFFEAYGWNLTYNQRSMVGTVSEYFAGGLTIFA